MVIVCIVTILFFFSVNIKTETEYKIISKYLPNVQFEKDSINIKKIDDNQSVVNILSFEHYLKNNYIFHLRNKEVISEHRLPSYIPNEEKPLIWERKMYNDEHSIVVGVFDHTRISKINIGTIPSEQIVINKVGDVSIFFTTEYYPDLPEEITGESSQGTIVFSSTPMY